MDFSVQVVKHVIQENLAKGESVVCSPASIDAVLRILALGSEKSTRKQLLNLLGHDNIGELNAASTELAKVLKASEDTKTLEVSYVNGLWLDQRFTLKAEFEKVLKEVYHAQVSVVDFINQPDEAVKEANLWAEKETKGLIKEILEEKSISEGTVLLLANALYFKGTWLKPFNQENTENDFFNLLDGHKVRVPFLNQWCEYFSYGTTNECQVVKMQYERGPFDPYTTPIKTFSMYIFLPYERNGLADLIEKIKIDKDMFEKQIVKLEYVEITKLSIPKFKFESFIPLKETMKQLGLTLPFEENCRDFSEMINAASPVYVGNMFQKCCVETNEQGTEAAAVTVVSEDELGFSYEAPPEINFVANHPFMFIIREDDSGALLFIGTMLNPQ
ncbi:serpin-Z10-like [Silene latifolia]|uniref:serpin-Z10-like n=1 Tax=Silene latifolia TaxID=37657 RepID=UPI003D76AB8D